MDDATTPSEVGQDLVATIVSSYVEHNRVPPNELSTLIASVHQALSALGKPAPLPEPLRPAVPVRRSVQPEYVVCLECGFRGRTLRRHLRIQHGLDPTAYRTRWTLLADYPMTAPGYSERRSAMAKTLRFGRRRQAAAPASPEPRPAPPGKPRRRSRSSARAQAAPST